MNSTCDFADGDPGLAGISDFRLKDELERREKERKRILEEDIAKKKIDVVCPKCNGSGQEKIYDISSGYTISAECRMCKGNQIIKAIKVF